MPLHLAFFLPNLDGGGAQRVVTTLVNRLAARGHHVDLLLTSKRGPFVSAVNSRVQIHSFDREHTLHTLPPLIRTLRRRQPDILVSALLPATVAAFGAVTWMRQWGERPPPLCATVHSLLRAQAEPPRGLRSRLLLAASALVLRRIRTIVAVSHTAARDLADFTGRDEDEIHVIPNPTALDTIRNEIRTRPPHPWLRQDVPVVVTAGRLCPQKEISTLLRALALLHSQRDVRALILGAGPSREALESLSRELGVAEIVEFLGFVNNPYPHMAEAAVFALPSPAEAFGNVVVEALACGTPVVATRGSGGPCEIMDGLPVTDAPLVPPHDPSALADAISGLLTSSIDTAALQQRAQDFDVSSIVDRYESLFYALGPTGPDRHAYTDDRIVRNELD